MALLGRKGNPRGMRFVGIAWMLLGVKVIVDSSTWLGIAMIASGVCWLAYAVYTARVSPQVRD